MYVLRIRWWWRVRDGIDSLEGLELGNEENRKTERVLMNKGIVEEWVRGKWIGKKRPGFWFFFFTSFFLKKIFWMGGEQGEKGWLLVDRRHTP